ncbi:MAG: PAS domain-containing sensor histidine kinase [Emcibacteraceae bacterium]|nr:PAS domain-containing sensor histidine kinase [Emcibacteraceae bacterium]MDG1994877.1 PAS domain-containing sensor histidine kinase [Emcibacteraceae bacterium]
MTDEEGDFKEIIPDKSPIEEDSFEYVKEAVSQLIELEDEKKEEPPELEVQPNATSVTDELFWEIDRYGNIVYLSDNSEALFLLPSEKMVDEDFLCLWHRDKDGEKDHNDFIALFEKRLPFRDEPFSIDVSPNVIHQYLLSAIATFDIENGRFTGFRGSAHIDKSQFIVDDLTNNLKSTSSPALKPVVEKNDINDDLSNNNDDEPLIDNDTGDEVASELLHNLSHEFRTPLNAIIGFSQMIDSEMWGPVSNQYKKNTKNIIYAANHLKDAVNNILDSAKIEAGLILPTPESFSLKSVIQDAMYAVAPILETKELNVSGIDDNIDVILYNDKHCITLCLIKMITYATRKANLGDDLHISVMVSSNAEVRIEMPLINQKINESDSYKETSA